MGCGCRKSAKIFSFLQAKPKFTISTSSSPSSTASSSSLYRHGFSGERSNYSLRYLLDAETAFKAPAMPPCKSHEKLAGWFAVAKDNKTCHVK
ncbi:hypothetical protein SAY86_007751 [Trapa natans]|uniref:Uncharacterized protein n=1 Tax=Trapa natans TaxID=22666 RepID=A0AAN7QY63_TRANT|nr:hypothetical protein SAY86_007751 [Trapa natans]